MTKYRVTYRHKDIGEIELVRVVDLKADTPELAHTELNHTKPAYITYNKIEKIE